MPILHDFEYEKPGTVAEAVAVLNRHGAEAAVLAGGTDLVGWLREEVVTPKVVMDIKAIPELREIRRGEGCLRIGAAVPFNALLDSAEVVRDLPLLAEAAGRVGSCGLRNRATLAGNICSAVPCCDGGPPLLVLEAEVELAGPGGIRRVPAAGWFREKRQTARAADELVTAIRIPVPPRPSGGAYVKLGRYRGEDLAQASVAVLAMPGGVWRVAFGALAARPLRAPKIEARLAGKDLSDALIGEVQALLDEEIRPITDIRATKEYRRLATAVMLERALRAAADRLAGRGPAYGTRLV